MAHAQQPAMPVIGVLMNRAADDPEGQAPLAALVQRLQDVDRIVDRNVRLEVHWGADIVELERKYAAELIAIELQIVVAAGTLGIAAVQGVSRSVPIVFAAVTDPVEAGFVDLLARPGGNATGFMIYEYSLSGKWLELLQELRSCWDLRRVAVVRDPANPAGICDVRSRCRRRRSHWGIQVGSRLARRNAGEIERAVTAFAKSAHGGMIVTPKRIGLGQPRFVSSPCNSSTGCRPFIRSVNLPHRGGRPDLLRPGQCRPIPPCRGLYRSHSQRCKSPPSCRCKRRQNTSW